MTTWHSVASTLPRWTIPPDVSPPPGSRDPLGFQRYAARFADNILPDLTVLTTRARYYAFLAWMLEEIELAAEPRHLVGDAVPYEEYAEIVARFERLLALAEAAQHSSQNNGCSWIGMRRSRSLVKGSRASLPLDVSLTVREGTNGALANYRLSMQSIGLLEHFSGILPDLLTDDGRQLADIFRRAVQKAKAKRASQWCLDMSQRNVSIGNLEDIGRRMCLSRVSVDERDLLAPRLLGDKHAAIVSELRSTFKRRLRSQSESKILKFYLQSDSRSDMAFRLEQIAIYQAFALACLGLFEELLEALEIGQERPLSEIVVEGLTRENIEPASTVGALTRHVEVMEAIDALENQSDDSIEPGKYIRPALRLLVWLAHRVSDKPALVFGEPVDSVSLQDTVGVVGHSEHRIDQTLKLLYVRLVSDHQRVFASKFKRPWLNLNGTCLRLDDIYDLSLGFPPNSVRLNSLLSIMRDLETSHD